MLRTQLTKRAVIGHALLPLSVALFLTFLPLKKWVAVSGTQAFLNFSSIHSVGYPFFLAFLEGASLSPLQIATLQAWFYALAVFSLALGIFRVSANHFFALLTALCLSLNPFILNTHFMLLPDSVFISLMIFAVGFLLHALASAGFLSLIAFGLSIGFAASLQPYGLAYLPLILLAAPLFTRRNHCSLLKAFLLPAITCAAILTLESTAYHTLNEDHEFSPAAPHIFANTVLMPGKQASPYAPKDPRTTIWEKIETDLAGIRQEIWNTESFQARKKLLHSQTRYVSRNFAPDFLEEAGAMLGKTTDDIRMDIATSRIVQAPLSFAKITFTHYRAIWSSSNMLSYPFWALSLFTVIFGLWAWLRGAAFNGPFALAFCCAFGLQAQTLLSAHNGLGPDNPLMFLSPLLTLNLLGLVLGFYSAFINPPHTHI